MASSFQFKNAALMMALAAAYPLQAHAVSAGVAQFASGDVSVRRGTVVNPITKGFNLESGDAITTGEGGRAQIRFSDNGLVSLQPNSQFNISKYSDANDPKQDAFLVDLLRGGMRAITGLIGKRNRENFRVTTTTATIGIRGSAFLLGYLPDGTLAVSTELDAIEVCTTAGCIVLTAGESAIVTGPNQMPVRTNTRASVPLPDPLRAPVIAGENVNPDGRASIVPVRANAGPSPNPDPGPGPNPDPGPGTQPIPKFTTYTGMGFAGAGTKPNTNAGFSAFAVVVETPPESGLQMRNATNGSLVVQTEGGGFTPAEYQAADGSKVALTGTYEEISVTGQQAAGDLLILGTWSAAAATDANGVATQIEPFGFVSGQATPTTTLASLSGQRAEYAFSNATPVFSTYGTAGQLLASSKLTVDFLGAGTYANVDLNVRFPGTGSGENDYKLTGGVTGTGNGFAGGLAVTSPNCLAGNVDCGTGTFSGFYSGATAANVGLSYAAYGTEHGDFGGAATFHQTGAQVPTPQTAIEYNETTVKLLAPNWFDDYSTSNAYNGTVHFKGEEFVKFQTFNPQYDASVEKVNGAASQFGSLGKVGDADFIGWGMWAQASRTPPSGGSGGSGGPAPAAELIDYVHYVTGTPTPYYQMPSQGTANFALIGGTAPTATGGSNGRLLGGSLSVDFNSNFSVAVNIKTAFGPTASPTTVDINVPAGNIYRDGNQFSTCGNGTVINGMFTGESATRAGLVYRASETAVGTVTGAAVFGRTSAQNLGYTPASR
ncbi:MAG: hypothetical protein EOO28_10005 [Comamonadaceae bacterium]|nr:MAG: hypothetical protein EOO28_10005 [Comamonadaceae bacterium]